MRVCLSTVGQPTWRGPYNTWILYIWPGGMSAEELQTQWTTYMAQWGIELHAADWRVNNNPGE